MSTNDIKARAVLSPDARSADREQGPERPKGPLTDATLRTGRPGKARYDQPDRDGLVLRVGTRGSMTWTLTHRAAGGRAPRFQSSSGKGDAGPGLFVCCNSGRQGGTYNRPSAARALAQLVVSRRSATP